MRTVLLIISIVLIAACVLSLLFAALNLFAYRNTLDGSAELYSRMHRRTIVFFVLGAVLAAAGAACLIIRSRI